MNLRELASIINGLLDSDDSYGNLEVLVWDVEAGDHLTVSEATVDWAFELEGVRGFDEEEG